jgi:hypothetical protein
MNKKLFWAALLLPLSIFQIAFADTTYNAGEVQLDVGGVLLDFEQTSTVEDLCGNDG